MFQAYLEGEGRVSAHDMINPYGQRSYERERAFRDASHGGNLRCMDCDAPLVVKAGPKLIPHFAHKAVPKHCDYYKYEIGESEDHRQGIRALYDQFQRRVDGGAVTTDHKLSNGRRANLMVQVEDQGVAVEFVHAKANYQAWIQKHQDYVTLDLEVVWVFSPRNTVEDQDPYDFNAQTILKETGKDYLVLFDPSTDKMTYLALLTYVADQQVVSRNVFTRSYNLLDVSFEVDTFLTCARFTGALKEAQTHYQDAMAADEARVEGRKVRSLAAYHQREKDREALKTRRQEAKGQSKSLEELMDEAMDQVEKRPQGPWYDSLEDARWGFCTVCGQLTKDWVVFAPDNTCTCSECAHS